MTKAPFTGKGERASDLLGLIHSDVCGPMNTQARGGFQYFITFTDDFSRYGYIYLMGHKSEAHERFKEFKNEVQNQYGKSIDKCLLALCFRMIFTPLRVICRELISLGRIQKQQDLDEGSCTEATPIEKT
ncbi:hypothetical protein V6N13_001764 [Hibiscus sabdariffa]